MTQTTIAPQATAVAPYPPCARAIPKYPIATATAHAVGSSHSDSALPVLVAGFVAIGGGVAVLVYFRRRRSEAHS